MSDRSPSIACDPRRADAPAPTKPLARLKLGDPLRIVSTAIPVARNVAVTPPRPAARASLAAHNRRWRSFNPPASALNLLTSRRLVNHIPTVLPQRHETS